MADKLSTTGAERGADTSQEVGFSATKVLFHPDDHSFKDILDITPPTAVDIGQYIFFGVKEDNSLAVGKLYHESKEGDIRNNSIG
jgi:hypothetical protein